MLILKSEMTEHTGPPQTGFLCKFYGSLFLRKLDGVRRPVRFEFLLERVMSSTSGSESTQEVASGLLGGGEDQLEVDMLAGTEM